MVLDKSSTYAGTFLLQSGLIINMNAINVLKNRSETSKIKMLHRTRLTCSLIANAMFTIVLMSMSRSLL